MSVKETSIGRFSLPPEFSSWIVIGLAAALFTLLSSYSLPASLLPVDMKEKSHGKF